MIEKLERKKDVRLIGFVGVGHDRKNSAYWYFYGTRLYREDYVDSLWDKKSRIKNKRRRKRKREEKEEKEGEDSEDDSVHEENRESVWQVVCFTQQDWSRLVDKFRDSVIFFFLTQSTFKCTTSNTLITNLSIHFFLPRLFDSLINTISNLKQNKNDKKNLQF